MSRSQPYRSRLPIHILQLLDVATRITLFLVGQSGPLCFTFKDRLENKYKTSIGSQVKCTCSSQRNDHCIHSLYVMIKIFKVGFDCPIIWQAAYLDSELSDLLAGKFSTVTAARPPRPVFDPQAYPTQLSQTALPSQLFRAKQFSCNLQSPLVEPLALTGESVCPICQDTMKETMCLSYCKVKCGNYFHVECLIIWARHRLKEQSSITCPMCRTEFVESCLQEWEHQQRQFRRKEQEKIRVQFICAGCGVTIPNDPHKCLLCTKYELCIGCYKLNKHIKHPFIRRDDDNRWRGAQQRRENELRIQKYLQKKKKESVNAQLLEKLRKIDEDPDKLPDYLASAYPYVSKYISEHIDPYKKMDFDPADIRCSRCQATRMLFLRRLNCGHFVDHQCLKVMIEEGKFHCEEDGAKILKGYEDLLGREKEVVRQKKKMEMEMRVDMEFDPRKMEEELELSEGEMDQAEMSLPQMLSDRRREHERSAERERERQRQMANKIKKSTQHITNSNIRKPPTVPIKHYNKVTADPPFVSENGSSNRHFSMSRQTGHDQPKLAAIGRIVQSKDFRTRKLSYSRPRLKSESQQLTIQKRLQLGAQNYP